MSVAAFTLEGEVGLIEIHSPPVNALGIDLRQALYEGFQKFTAVETVKAVVLIGVGKSFLSGADLSEVGNQLGPYSLSELCDKIDGFSKPTVAAIHGTASGGGLELALACNYRIGTPAAKMGLPEVNLGLLPSAGGTQRLPRIVGARLALDLIVSGRSIDGREALTLGMIDALAAEESLREDAVAFARSIVAEGRPLRRVRDRQDKIEADRGKPEIFADFREQHARATRGFKAPENIIKAIEAAIELSFDGGLARERELFHELHQSAESLAQRYYLVSERETSKIPDVPPTTPVIPLNSVGVIGAGTMGGGITMNFLNVGLPVTLVDMDQGTLDRGIGVIRRNYENTAKKGRMTIEQVEQRMALITPASGLSALAQVDLVIEAVFEEMSVKKTIFNELDGLAKQGSILASNTSFLDLDEIAAATSRPEWVIGLHFFSPANVMRLLEAVRGAKTSNDVIATAMDLAKRIGKVPVLSRVCHGFIANRIMAQRTLQADALVLEGPTPEAIDRALYEYGFAMGPFAMLDLVGLDVIGRGETERTVRGDLVKMGRLGQKKNGGYYDYDERRKATPSPIAARLIAEIAIEKGITKIGAQSDNDIVARLLYPVINEGAKLLDEGVALRASDIDVAAILGYNWPVYRGGPMFWADSVGLPKIVAKLKELEAERGDSFAPAPLLVKLAAKGGSFTR